MKRASRREVWNSEWLGRDGRIIVIACATFFLWGLILLPFFPLASLIALPVGTYYGLSTWFSARTYVEFWKR